MEEKSKQTYPACFESPSQWEEYVRLWKYSRIGLKFNMCYDCTPEWRDQMTRENRCAHPETVFVIQDGDLVGVTGDVWFSWVSALTGKRGTLVSQPAKEVRDRFIAENKVKASAEGRYLLMPEARARHKPNKKKESSHE